MKHQTVHTHMNGQHQEDVWPFEIIISKVFLCLNLGIVPINDDLQ